MYTFYSSLERRPGAGRNPSGAIARVILKVEELSKDQSDGVLLCTITGISLGAGDFGISPGCGEIIYIGNGEDYPPLHTAGYDFNDRILETAVDLFTALAKKDNR